MQPDSPAIGTHLLCSSQGCLLRPSVAFCECQALHHVLLSCCYASNEALGSFAVTISFEELVFSSLCCSVAIAVSVVAISNLGLLVFSFFLFFFFGLLFVVVYCAHFWE